MSIDRETLASLTFRSKSMPLVRRAVDILEAEHPMTLRQLFYRVVSAGALENTKGNYDRLGNVMKRLRESGAVPLTWIVDHVRQTLKPSSWSGLADFGDTVRDAYRKDFWSSLDHHVEVFVEKDAVAGTIQPVTEQYDIALRVCRGYSSISFAGEIAAEWRHIEKPIHAYYLGDYDPSGFDLERDLREKLERYGEKSLGVVPYCQHDDWIRWERLGVLTEDFDLHNLIPLPPKRTDTRYKKFIEEHGNDCAELDAIPPVELRRRVENAIERHIDQERWAALQSVEALEKQTVQTMADAMEPVT